MECDGLPLIMFWLLRGIKVAVTLFCRPSLEFLKILKSQLFYYSLRNETHFPVPKKYQVNKNGTPQLLYLLAIWRDGWSYLWSGQ